MAIRDMMEVTHNFKRRFLRDHSEPLSAIRVIRDIPYVSSVDDLTPHRHKLDIYYLPPTHDCQQDAVLEAAAEAGTDSDSSEERVHGVTIVTPVAARSARRQSSHNHQQQQSQLSHKTPVIIHFNGGGWVRGSKDSEWRGAPPVGRAAARHGLVAVCANYRLAPLSTGSIVLRALLLALILWLLPPVHQLISYALHTSYTFLVLTISLFTGLYCFYFVLPTRRRYVVHPQMMADPASVVKWVIEHINEYVETADISQLFLSGHSAGSHLVSLLATDHSYLRHQGIDIHQHVRGVFAVSGIYDLIEPMESTLRNLVFAVVYASGLCAGYFNTPVWHSASSLRFVNQQTIPMMLLSGASDMGLESGSKKMYEALRASGVWSRWYTIDNTSHATIASLLEHHQAHKHLLEMVDCLRTDRPKQNGTADQESFAASEAEPVANGHSSEQQHDTVLSKMERVAKTLA